jgi:hypothetical protein
MPGPEKTLAFDLNPNRLIIIHGNLGILPLLQDEL